MSSGSCIYVCFAFYYVGFILKKAFLSYLLERETSFSRWFQQVSRFILIEPCLGYEDKCNWATKRLNILISRPESYATSEYGGHWGPNYMDWDWELFSRNTEGLWQKTHWECQNWKIEINSCSFQSTLLPTVLWYNFCHNRLSPVPCLFSSWNECLFLFQSIDWPRFSLCLWLGICLCVYAFPFFLFSEWHSFRSNSGFQASSILRPTISKFFQRATDRGRYGGWVYIWASFMGQTWRCIYDFWLYFTCQNLGTWLNLPTRGTEKRSSSLSTVETWTSFTESIKLLLLGSLKRIYALVQTMSILPCSLCLSPRLYYGSSTLWQETLIALERSLSNCWDQLSDPHVANCFPRLPINPCLILEVTSAGQVRVSFDSPNLITRPSTHWPQ